MNAYLSLKNAWLLTVFFLDFNTLSKVCFSPTVTTFAKNASVLGGTVLSGGEKLVLSILLTRDWPAKL